MMMTLDAVRLSTPLQALVDARLDTIERMLLGRITRADRLAIVRDVETQIHEQLQGRNTDDMTREDVLAVLATLDPPEAYLPEEVETDSNGRRIVLELPARSSQRRSPPSAKAKAKASGILGIVMLICAVLTPVFFLTLAMAMESEVVLFFGGGFAILMIIAGAIVSIVLAFRAGLRNGWAVTGLVTSLCTMPVVFGLLLLLFLEMA